MELKYLLMFVEHIFYSSREGFNIRDCQLLVPDVDIVLSLYQAY